MANLYADVTPDLMRILDSGTDVGNNIDNNQARFEQLLAAAIGTGETGKTLLSENGDQLVKALADLRASTSLLAEYSPMLTCLIVGLNQGVEGATSAFGGKDQPGLVFKSGFQQGARAYSIPGPPQGQREHRAPLLRLPFPDPDVHAPFVVTDTAPTQWRECPTCSPRAPDPFGPSHLLGGHPCRRCCRSCSA